MSEVLIADNRTHTIIPQLSVIVPVYNTAAYVIRTLTSLRSNNGLEFEVIIIDDGSTDKSLEIIVDWSSRFDGNTLIINQKNKGLSAARNTALRYARGKYISFCDSDDWVDFSVVHQAVNYAEKNFACIVMFRSLIYDNYTQVINPFYDSELWDKALVGKSSVLINSATHPYLLSFEPNTNNRIILRSFFKEGLNKFRENVHFEDIYPHIFSMLKAKKIGLINKVGYYYRVNRNGKITEQRNEKRFDMLKVAEEILHDVVMFPMNPQQNYFCISLLVKMIYWCGACTRSSARNNYFQQNRILFDKNNELQRHLLTNAMQNTSNLKEAVLMYAMLSKNVSFLTAYTTGKRSTWKFTMCVLRNSFFVNLVFCRKILTILFSRFFR